MSSGRYAQAALTYARSWQFRVYAATAAGYALGVFLVAPPTGPRNSAGQLTMVAGMLWVVAVGSAIVAAHLKSQFAHVRAAVTPSFRTPHLLVGAVVLIVLTFGFTALVAPRLGLSMVGALSVVSLVVASTAWWVHHQSLLAATVCNVLWLSLLNRRVTFTVGHVIFGRLDGLAAVLLAVGIAALVALWFRLGRMNEEMREYSRRMTPEAMARLGAGDAGASGRETWHEFLIRRPIETRCIAAANLWARVRHLRATGLGRFSWLMAAGLAVSILIIPLLTGAVPAAGALEGFMIFTMMLPTFLVFPHWARRWPSLGYESLRPASRGRFVREVGLAMGLDLAEAWTVITIAGLVPMVVASPAAVIELARGGFLPLSAAMAVAAFAMNVWILRFRTTAATVLAMALTAFAPLLPFVLNRTLASSGAILPIALGLLVLGALVTVDAYARWCRTDFD